ncbi:MAG: hypothetical protein KKA30_16175 [Alphaproteobacteria bacterium]|nr:hypothetical protein [Alphaproteobacteria bacterium]MBU2306822.1 hypothetical protein [Alphaproteobacteria bacterium]
MLLILGTTIPALPAAAQERASPPRPGVGQLPPGSYLASCRGARLNGNMLSAQCPGPSGAPIMSSLDTNSCRGRDIANDRGYLRCDGGGGGGPRPPRPPGPVPPTPPGPQPPMPPGHNVQAIVYTRADFRGQQLVVRGPIANLANYRGFNDAIRSVRITRGSLTVCADARYQGRCVTLRSSARDLNAVGMANRISSIR